MSHKSSDNVGLHVSGHLLSDEVSVEDSILATEEVRLVLVVVFLEVVDEAGTHVSVVGARSNGRVDHRSSQFVEPSGSEPDRSDNKAEVDED